jgi:glycosyltransferase involved in cell wall biosynthesis
MTVSVIIPAWNAERYLAEALASVRAQTVAPLEILVVDDGSSDGGAALAAATPGVTVVAQAHAGVAAARNRGIARARGTLLAFLDADDLWEPRKLELQLASLAAAPELGGAVCHYQNFLEQGLARPAWLSERALAEPQAGGLSSLVVRAEVFARVGVFDPADASDLDWSLRARAAGVTLGVCREVLVRRRVHDANFSHGVDGRRATLRVLRGAVARARREGR